MIKVIKDGDSNKKGTHSCPQCGEKVVIDRHWGDPPKCDCGTIYTPTFRPPHFH